MILTARSSSGFAKEPIFPMVARGAMTSERRAARGLGDASHHATMVAMGFITERMKMSMEENREMINAMLAEFLEELAPRDRRLGVRYDCATGDVCVEGEEDEEEDDDDEDDLPPKAVRDGGYCNVPFANKPAKKASRKNVKKREREEGERDGETGKETPGKKRKTGAGGGAGRGQRKKKASPTTVGMEEGVTSSTLTMPPMAGNVDIGEGSPSTLDHLMNGLPPTGASIFEGDKA